MRGETLRHFKIRMQAFRRGHYSALIFSGSVWMKTRRRRKKRKGSGEGEEKGSGEEEEKRSGTSVWLTTLLTASSLPPLLGHLAQWFGHTPTPLPPRSLLHSPLFPFASLSSLSLILLNAQHPAASVLSAGCQAKYTLLFFHIHHFMFYQQMWGWMLHTHTHTHTSVIKRRGSTQYSIYEKHFISFCA